ANRTASRLTWAYSDRVASAREPYSSITASDGTRKSASAWLRMSVTRFWRVRIWPLMTKASVYSVSGTSAASAPIRSNICGEASAAVTPVQRSDSTGSARPIGLSPGACGHQLLGALLEALVQRADGLERVDLVGRLVRAPGGAAAEPERIARLVAARADDDVEGDLDDDGRLHLAI